LRQSQCWAQAGLKLLGSSNPALASVEGTYTWPEGTWMDRWMNSWID
jgi:hypothetical protein